MRTTLTLADDVAAEIDRLRREEGLGLSAALNLLARRGMVAPQEPAPYEHRTADLGLKVDVSNIGEVLDLLDER
jgi:hypothetical protein